MWLDSPLHLERKFCETNNTFTKPQPLGVMASVDFFEANEKKATLSQVQAEALDILHDRVTLLRKALGVATPTDIKLIRSEYSEALRLSFDDFRRSLGQILVDPSIAPTIFMKRLEQQVLGVSESLCN